jgi:hypothetical protein
VADGFAGYSTETDGKKARTQWQEYISAARKDRAIARSIG